MYGSDISEGGVVAPVLPLPWEELDASEGAYECELLRRGTDSARVLRDAELEREAFLLWRPGL